jgi:cytochrome c-type biogenesis protein CcmH
MTRILIALLLALAVLQVQAREAPPAAADPALEKRAMKLAAELRCLVCQNQSLAESHAGLALDLKEQVRSQIRAGRSDAEIRQYMVDRYGDFVLYSPPWKASTLLLWTGPFILLLAGALVLVTYLKKRRARVVQADLTDEQRARAQALLGVGRDGG